jgi:hypothetical protein
MLYGTFSMPGASILKFVSSSRLKQEGPSERMTVSVVELSVNRIIRRSSDGYGASLTAFVYQLAESLPQCRIHTNHTKMAGRGSVFSTDRLMLEHLKCTSVRRLMHSLLCGK